MKLNLDLTNLSLIIILLVFFVILYKKYQEKNSYFDEAETYKTLNNYLLEQSDLEKSKKPILWIHVPYEYNSRKWINFGSRGSCELNQPYLYLTVKSIIQNCDNSFKVCIIDDTSFEKLIPDWNINISTIPAPSSSYVRSLALSKLIYTYGGMVVPISFLCSKDLISLYEKGTIHDRMFIGENIDMNITSTNYEFYPNIEFMGANKGNDTVQQLVDFMQRQISRDYTSQTEFLGEFNRWANSRVQKSKINLIPGTDLGTKTIQGEPVLVENLLGDDYIDFYDNMYGIWIPGQMILKRTYYEWFCRMSAKQIMESKFILAKYILLMSIPRNRTGKIEQFKNKPNWINFWKVPSSAPVWGPMPLNLGDHVPKEKY